MKVMIAAPAFGGMVTAGFAHSLHQTTTALRAAGIDYSVVFITGESLIQRARNSLATQALLDRTIDRIFFVDVDLSFTPQQFIDIATSRRRVIGGTYPVKGFPIRMNVNYLESEREFNGTSPEEFAAFARARADGANEAQVRHAPTGFLSIHRVALEALADRVGTYQVRFPSSGEVETHYNFFPVEVRDGQLMSEDWMFCQLCRDAGIPVYLNVSAVLPHTGAYTFTHDGA